MKDSTEVKRYLLAVARGVYVLMTCAVVLMALSMLNLGGH